MKTLLKLVFSVSILSLFLGACAGRKINAELLNEEMNWVYTHPKAACFDATVAALKDNGVGVKSASKETGIIQTERVVYATGAVGNAYGAQVITAEHQMSLKISGNSKNCSVVGTRYQVWQNRVPSEEIMVPYFRNSVWTPLRTSIQQNLDDGPATGASAGKKLDI